MLREPFSATTDGFVKALIQPTENTWNKYILPGWHAGCYSLAMTTKWALS